MKRASYALVLLLVLSGNAAAQPSMVADENGTVVFGQNPAKVEVMNLPESGGTTPAVVTLFDGVVSAGALGALGTSVPVQDYRSYVLFGDAHEVGGGRAFISFNCYGSIDPWQSIIDDVPKALSFVGEIHSGFLVARDNAYPGASQGMLIQGRNPTAGPLLRCVLARNFYGDLKVKLQAYLTN